MYKVTKVVFGKFCGLTDALVGDQEGGLLISEEIDAHRAEHFGEVLDRLLPTAEVDNKEAGQDLQVNTAPPEKEEIISAIKSLKDRNAPGKDSLNAELFKAALGFAAEINSSTLYNHMGKKRRNEWCGQRASL